MPPLTYGKGQEESPMPYAYPCCLLSEWFWLSLRRSVVSLLFNVLHSRKEAEGPQKLGCARSGELNVVESVDSGSSLL